MKDNSTEACKNLLKETGSILLVDWANEEIPHTLIKAGYIVYSYSPGKYSLAQLETCDGTEKLHFSKFDQPPTQVDLVYIYRPEAEHPAIVNEHVLPLKAKALWLHPPVTSVKTALLAAEYGLTFIEGISITDVIKNL